MYTSTFALILGTACYLVGLPMIFNEKKAIAWKRKFLKNDLAMRSAGAVCVIIALLTLKTQWYLTADADGILVVLAWMTLAKGLVLAWWPQSIASVKASFDQQMESVPLLIALCGLILVVIGACLTYLGFILL